MKHLKLYFQYIKESITTDVDGLLSSINQAISIPRLGQQLFKDNLKKGEIESTLEIENFLRKDIDMKFFFLYDRNESILDNPNFLILQYYKDNKCYPI